jgi:signal transduction histidine kinase
MARNSFNRSPEELEVLVQQRTAALRNLSARLLRVQDKERRHLSRELHDSTGQTLTALKIHLVTLQERLKAGQPTVEIFAQINALADQALQEIRTTSYLLYPPLLDEAGLSSAAQWYIEGFAKRSSIQVRLHLASIGRLPRPVETALFRILQESLTNVYRHSSSRIVDVWLQLHADTVILEVQDYGTGIPREILEQFKRTGGGAGVGLAGMQERIEDLSGKLEMISGSAGTKVRATLPVTDAAHNPGATAKPAPAAAA